MESTLHNIDQVQQKFEEAETIPPSIADRSPWPKISIVTPSFNQAQYLEETIRSILSQGYPNLEYIIIDGGSTDGSIEIIRKYEPWLTYWVSEKDKGQSHAINKGFSHSTGEILAWINSDDFYAPGTFIAVAEAFRTSQAQWVAGKCYSIDVDGTIYPGREKPINQKERLYLSCFYTQPEVFWKRELWLSAGGVDEELHYAFDYDLWLKFTAINGLADWVDQYFAYFRLHPESKSCSKKELFEQEERLILPRHYQKIKNVRSRFLIWRLRREQKANQYFSEQNKALPPLRKIFWGVFYAPWFIFQRKFYAKVKQILFASKQ